MDSVVAINEKLNEIESEILGFQIKLRDKEIEKAAYENAVFLIKGGTPKPRAKKFAKDETNYSVGGKMFRLRAVMRKQEKRVFTISELAEFMNYNQQQKRILGVDISSESRKGRCFIGHNQTQNERYTIERGLYGLKEYYHLFESGYDEDEDNTMGNNNDDEEEEEEEEEEDKTNTTFRKDGRLFKVREALLVSKRPMTLPQLMSACGIPTDERKTFGHAVARGARGEKGFLKIRRGEYGLVEYKDIY